MILARVRRTLRERGLLSGGERVLVACSGGPDSAALLDVLSRLSGELALSLFAASVDHGLRPDAARDVETAKALADRLAIPFLGLRVEVAKEGPSLMAKARRVRERALFEEAARVGATFVAVGHTLDDQAETVLSRLLRGSGVAGLAGIEPRRADGMVRPLIDCRRADVRAHAERHGLPFVDDPSNRNEAFERARLRKEVLPLLSSEDPRVAEHLAWLADDARAVRELVRRAAGELFEAAVRGDAIEAAPLLAAAPPVQREVLARWASERTGGAASRAHVEALARTLAGHGETLLPGELRARVEDGALRAVRAMDLPTRSRPRP